MVGPFGNIVQLGYVVADMDEAIEHWTTVLGVGPFFVASLVPYGQVEYRGQPCSAQISVGLASHKGLQIEIIQQVGGGASIFDDFVKKTGGGLHHMCALAEDIEADLKCWQERGVEVLMSGDTAAGIPFAYLDTDPEDRGRVLELVQPTPGLLRYFEKIDTACSTWDSVTKRIDIA